MKGRMFKQVLSLAVATNMAIGANAEVRSLFIYHTDGVEPIFISEIESIRMTDVDRNGVKYGSPVVQEFVTADTVYSYHMSEIEKVSFHLPTVPKESRYYTSYIDLTDDLAEYIECVDYELNNGMAKLTLKPNVPADLIPKERSYIYQIASSDAVPYGLLGQVGEIDGLTLYWYPRNPTEIFESLEYVTDYSAEVAPQGAVAYAPGQVPWYASDCNLPYSTVHKMTDELRDIPVGAEYPYVDCKLRMQPIINCQTGVYVIPAKSEYENAACVWRMHSALKVNVEASADGRCILDKDTLGHTGDGIQIMKVPFGLGQSMTAKFKATIKGSGSMGVKYDYKASYTASAVTSVMAEGGNSDAAAGATVFNNRVTSAPAHTLDASLSGKLTMTGSITLSVTGMCDSLKAVSQVYTYGTALSGDALYRTSELEAAHESQALYERITSSGVKASPVETLMATAKYASLTIKNKGGIKPTGSTTYYAVPNFGVPTYAQGTLSYPISGEPMHSVKSQLGTAIKADGKALNYVSSSHYWPGVTTFISNPAFSASKGDIVYPTATLQGNVILCSPSYPCNRSKLTPIITYKVVGGARVVSGLPFFGERSSATTTVIMGTPPGYLKPTKK